jgi:hypothetical protein
MLARVAVHATVWLALFGFWLVVTRGNQPTWDRGSRELSAAPG